MNIRKLINYSAMYIELDALMEKTLPQMELYCEIGRLVCSRTEKGAAIIASDYLRKNYADAAGFSPRNVRRMREFIRTYDNNKALMAEAMKIGWTQNVLIMERCADDAERQWYLRAVFLFGWSKLELAAKIDDEAHLKMPLASQEEVYDTESGGVGETNNADLPHKVADTPFVGLQTQVVEKPYPQPKTRGHPYRHRWSFSIMGSLSKVDHARSVNCFPSN